MKERFYMEGIMNREEFLEYIEENFTVSGEAKRLINNILFLSKNRKLKKINNT